MNLRVGLVVAFCAAGLALSGTAFAQSNAARAEALFQEGKTLLASKAFTEACPKLAESQRLDPADGTLMALAYCHEGEGKLAAAWTEYSLVAGRPDGRADRVQHAKARMAHIELQLPVAELDALRRGVSASAAPPPAPSAPPAHPVPVASAPEERGSERSDTESKRTLMRGGGAALGALGLVSLGVGTYFGLRARSLSDEARSDCDSTGCSALALQTNDEARNAARVSNVAIAGGAAALAGGVVIYLLAPKSKGQTIIAPTASATGIGAALQTVF